MRWVPALQILHVLGPDSALAAVILAVVLPLSAGDPQRAVTPGGAMAIVSGLVCVAAGLGRLGFITELLSKPIRYGYMNGIALTVILSQIPKLLGFSVKADGPLRQASGIVEGVSDGRTNLTALGVGGSALVLILLLKRQPRIPGMLVAVVAATVVVAVFDLAARAGLSVLGPLPQGLPAPRLPLVPFDGLLTVIGGGVRSRSSPSPIRAFSPAPMRRDCARQSSRTRKWSALAPRTWRPVSSRASRSAAARRGRRWRKLQGPERS